jgi:ankyrin repeat protein
MQLKKALLSILLCFAQIISASQPAEDLTHNEKLEEAIDINNINDDDNSIVALIQRDDVDINIKDDLKTTALSRLCYNAARSKELIDVLTKIIESPKSEKSDLESYEHNKKCHISTKKRYVIEYCTVLNAIDLLLSKNVNTNAVLWEVHEQNPETTLPFLFSYVHNHMQNEHSKLDINIQDANGNTPLHKAIKLDNTHINHSKKCRSQVLLELGADSKIKNKQGQAPADLAKPHIQPWITDPASGYLKRTESPLFAEDSVRMLQMPVYKQGKKGNLCKLIRQREHGFK